jgi:hypothetical protein
MFAATQTRLHIIGSGLEIAKCGSFGEDLLSRLDRDAGVNCTPQRVSNAFFSSLPRLCFLFAVLKSKPTTESPWLHLETELCPQRARQRIISQLNHSRRSVWPRTMQKSNGFKLVELLLPLAFSPAWCLSPELGKLPIRPGLPGGGLMGSLSAQCAII